MPLSVFASVLSGTYGKLGLFHRPGKQEKTLAMDCPQRKVASLFQLIRRISNTILKFMLLAATSPGLNNPAGLNTPLV
jgi:ABC-type Mn/Zn transport systems, ATPase component